LKRTLIFFLAIRI